MADEIGMLERRKFSILDNLENEPLNAEQVAALIDELAEIETALQKNYVGMDTVADAKREARFGVGL
jgi:hypothetical protein